ncbi:MAG: hypothetical protein GWM87_05585, partial [Xanthomonadales bacterium]|nr:peptidylprolyl isomerase [Xanthomonadales bacterium]NIX12453.1 hypothetical protein [Xanthomonadales bacterium]
MSDTALPGGKTVLVPLAGTEPGNLPLTFSVVSISDPRVQAAVLPRHRSLRFDVSGVDGGGVPFNGALVIALLENETPRTTGRIIAIAEQGGYDGLTFHRVIQDFMAQGGDPAGNGSGGTGLDFDDEFVQNRFFTGAGQMAMANSGRDTNDSQFFIT